LEAVRGADAPQRREIVMKVRRRGHPLNVNKRIGSRPEPGSHAPKMRTNAPVKPVLYTHDGDVADPRPRKQRVAA
jgi:hypothetical protein